MEGSAQIHPVDHVNVEATVIENQPVCTEESHYVTAEAKYAPKNIVVLPNDSIVE